jgi:hypothetical protein
LRFLRYLLNRILRIVVFAAGLSQMLASCSRKGAMTRITPLFMLVMLWSGTAFAVVYQCRNKDGTIFLTNNRDKFPPGCVQVGEPIGEERAPSPPAATPPPVRGSEPEMRDRRRPSAPPRTMAPPPPREETKPEAPSPEAGAPATGPGGAIPEQSGEQPPPQEEDQADERTDEVPIAPGQPDQPEADTPVEGGAAGSGQDK